MKFVIIELDEDGVIIEPWLVEAKNVKDALRKFAKHTDLYNVMEDCEEDFVNSYDEETHHAGDGAPAEVYIYNLTELQYID